MISSYLMGQSIRWIASIYSLFFEDDDRQSIRIVNQCSISPIRK